MKIRFLLGMLLCIFSVTSHAGDGHLGGNIISLMGSADPAIRLTGLASPNLCDGGPYGWLSFSGTAQEKQWIYATALAMALSGNYVTVYTNTDGGQCRISNIQITSGL